MHRHSVGYKMDMNIVQLGMDHINLSMIKKTTGSATCIQTEAASYAEATRHSPLIRIQDGARPKPFLAASLRVSERTVP